MLPFTNKLVSSAYMRKLRNKEETNGDTFFTTCLYSEKEPYDPDAEDRGLFRSEFLLKCFLHLYCGPNVARIGLGAPQAKSSKGDLYGMAGATPETIAYAACQVSFYRSLHSGIKYG
jgi:hypothetical protein